MAAVITIRGKLGSGASEVGRKVAEILHFDYIDREIIAEVATRLNLQEHEVLAKEMPPARLQERIAEALARGYSIGDGIQGAYLPMWQIPTDDNKYLEALTGFIRDLAKGQSAVIYGRGSQFILKDCPHALHVSMVAPLKLRIKRIMGTRNLSEDKAKQEINHFDGTAREFIKRFFSADMEESTHYDLILNTEQLSFEDAASIIAEALKFKLTSAKKMAEVASRT
jgi:cytidylate kinase